MFFKRAKEICIWWEIRSLYHIWNPHWAKTLPRLSVGEMLKPIRRLSKHSFPDLKIHDFPQFTMTCERRLERRAVLDTVCFENIAISPDGTLLVSASLTTPRIQLLSTKDLSSIHTMYGLFPKRIRSLAFSPNDGNCIISSGNDGKIHFWDVSQFYDKKEKNPEYWDASA